MVQNDSIFQELTALVAEPTSANAVFVVKAEESLIALSWKASPSTAELNETADIISDLIQQHNITRLLHNVRNLDFSNGEVQKSLTKTFMTKIMDAGIVKVVHLTNYATPDLIAVDRMVNYVKYKLAGDRKIKFEVCTTSAGALAWLTNGDIKPVTLPVTIAPEAAVFPVVQALTARLQSAKLILKLYKEFFGNSLRFAFKRKGGLLAE